MTETIECTCVEHDPYCCKIHGKCPKCTHTETIEQAKDRKYPLNKLEHLQLNTAIRTGFDEGAAWQSSQPNPHRIMEWQVIELNYLCAIMEISLSRMVEILNEIAAGKHKERIEI